METKDLGTKYYKFIDRKLDIVRIVKHIKDDLYLVKRNGSKQRMTESDFEGYTKLNPDGHVFFTLVHMGETEKHGKDVIVAFYRKQDLDQKISIPYAACRQNILDWYTQNLNPERHITPLGISMSQDTTPEGVEYETVLACAGVDHSDKVSVYFDDTLDSILECVPKVEVYGNQLYNNWKYLNDGYHYGVHKDLRVLLDKNDFIGDVLRGFGIERLDFDIRPTVEGYLTYDDSQALSSALNTKLGSPVCTLYTKAIDLKKIDRQYKLLRTPLNKTYILTYSTE